MVRKITDWFVHINKILSDAGCKSAKVKNIHSGDGTEYYHGKTKIKVCKLVTGKNGHSIVMHGNHFTTPYSVVNELPENMLQVLKNQRGCRPCSNPRTCTLAGNGGIYYEFVHNGKTYYCCGVGFRFNINEDTDVTELTLLEKWLAAELKWYANDRKHFPERKVNLDDIKSSHAKRWAKSRIKQPANNEGLSVFALPNKEQSQIKPPIDDACDNFLKDTELHLIALDLISYLRKQGADPHWKARNKYVFRYKKTELVYIRFENQNDFNIEICAFGWREHSAIKGFIESLTEDDATFLIKQRTFHCCECNEVCYRRFTFIFSNDENHVLCSGRAFVSENPSPDEVVNVKRHIDMGKKYIDYKSDVAGM